MQNKRQRFANKSCLPKSQYGRGNMATRKLHLGCGHDRKEGYINIDSSPIVKPDMVLDLEKLPLPVEDDSIDEIVANHVLEHIRNFVPLVHELHRISRSGTLIFIKTPFYAAWGQYNDPTHVRFFTPFTFDYFSEQGAYVHEAMNTAGHTPVLKARRIHLNYGAGRARILNPIMNPLINLHHAFYCRFFAWILPCVEIEYELEVVK